MTQTHWILVETIALDVTTRVHLRFFCPTDCPEQRRGHR